MIWLAYLAIPIVLVSFTRRRNLPFHWLFLLFGGFIVACGTTHLLEVVTAYRPLYRLSGLIKLVTALVSWATVVALVPVVPRVLAMTMPAVEVPARPARRVAWRGYLAGLVSVAVAALVRALLDPVLGDDYPHLTFIVAVIFVSWWGGPGPGVAAMVLGGVLGAYLFIEPRGGLPLGEPASYMGLGLYTFIGFATTLFTHTQGRSIEAAEASAREARRQEDLARLAAEQFRLLIEGVRDYGSLMLGPDGRIISWNAGAERLNGYRAEEAVGRHVSLFHSPEDVARGRPEQVLREAEAHGQAEDIGWRVRKDGTRYWADVVVTALRDEAGRLRGFVKVARDITERKRARDDLDQSEARYRTLIEALPQLVWTCLPDGQCDYLSRQWVEYTGRPEAEQLGYGWAEQLHPDDRDRATSRWMEAVEAEAPLDVNFRVRRSDGVYRWFKTRAVPFRDGDGRVVRWFGTNTDIDDQKRAEDEVRLLNATLERRVHERTAQLEEANRELESFSYSVSHDLRAPLRHIGGFAQLLQRQAAPALDGRSARHLETILQAAKDAGTLIDSLLAFSRMGRAELRRQPIAMGQLVEETRREMGLETDGRAIEWRVGPLPDVDGDATLLRQVWRNLLGNALKYTRGRDPAVIEVGAGAPAGGEVTFFVRDNGAGFDMRYAGKLFGVFQRLHGADEFEGTGIGLANVRRIVQRHGGRAWAEGRPGRGATLYFTLPKSRETES